MKRYLLDVVIEKDKHGYFAYCPLIQGCYTQGATYEEALENIKDAIKLHRITIPYHKGKILHPKIVKSIMKDAEITLPMLKGLL